MSEYGLMINYEFCTGCHSCEVACKLNKHLPAGAYGIKVLQDGPRKNPDGSWEYNYIPVPTSLCDLCEERVGEGRLPTCVHHCQSGCMYFDTIEELAKLSIEKPHSMIYRLAPQPDLKVATFEQPEYEKEAVDPLIYRAFDRPQVVPEEPAAEKQAKVFDEDGNLIIPQGEVNKAWDRAGGKCECALDGHGHDGAHGVTLNYMMQGGMNPIGWEAVPIDPQGEPVADNCLIICRTCLNQMAKE